MKVLTRVCNQFENKPIEIKFNERNIEMMISKMKKDNCINSTNQEHLMLECCLLFLCGFSYDVIASKMCISNEDVIKLLRDEKMLHLLSDEYLLLFQENQYRLNLNPSMREKIKNAVVTYVKHDGKVFETCDVLGIAPVTFRSYISNPDLEQIVDDPTLFLKFIVLRGNKAKHISLEQIQVQNEYQQLMKDLMMLKPTNMIEEKYLILAKAILIQGFDSIDDIVKNTELSRTSVVSYLEDFSRCDTFFPQPLLELLKKEGTSILKKANNKISFDEFVKYVISYYMSSRYTIDEMREIFKITRGEFKYIISEKSKEILSEEEFKNLEKHKNKIGHIGRGCPSDCFIVKDPKMIKILKPNVIYVNEYQNRLLTILNEVLNFYEQLCYMDSKQVLDVKIQFLNSNFNELEKILNHDFFLEVKSCLEIENLLVGNRLKDKKIYVMSIMKQFLECDMDLENTSEQLNISISTLIRILQDSSISIYYGSLLSRYIQGAIQEYRMMYSKKQTKENIQINIDEGIMKIMDGKKKIKRK